MAHITKMGLTEDPRTPLELMRRKDLYRFASAHGLTHITAEMAATDMRLLIQSKGLTGTEPFPAREISAQAYEELKEAGAANVELARNGIIENPESMNFFQLRSYAKRQGIHFTRTDTKDIILRRLNGENIP